MQLSNKDALAANSPFIYFALNSLRQCVGVSRGLAALLEVSVEDIENIPLSDLVHKNDIAKLQKLVDKSFERPTINTVCTVKVSFNKSQWNYLEIIISKLNKADNMLGCYCYEVSEKIKLQQHSDKITSLLSSTGSALKIGYWQLNIEQNIVFWSNEVYKIFGRSPATYIPSLSSALQAYHSDDLCKIDRALHEGLTHGKDWSIEARIVRENGELRHIITSGLPHRNEDSGAIDYIVGIIQDVTDLELVKNERDLLACAVKTTVAGMVISDRERKVEWANKGFEQLSGYTLDEVKGRSLKDSLHGPNSNKNTVLSIKKALDSKKPISTEILNYTKDGRAYWNKLIITPIIKNGQVFKYVGVQHDITEPIEAKHHILAINEKLEQRVKDRTLSLNQAVDELKKQADTDPLTGTYNRRALYQFFTSYKQSNSDKPLWLCIVDIDHFKKINDQYGHDCGDRVLIQLTNIIDKHIRDSDRLFRIGGEEFVIALTSITQKDALGFINRLHAIIRNTKFNPELEKLNVTVSIGMTPVRAGDAIDKSLISADKLLYRAKQNGRDRIESC